jgi:hypothetical protein
MPIRFARAYSSDPKKRLRGNRGSEALPLYDLEADDVTPADAGHGIVVGQRNYIMSNWRRDCDFEDGYSIDGKKRAMLLVSVGFTRAFVLVKPEDAECEPEAVYRLQMRELMHELQQLGRDKYDLEANYNALHDEYRNLQAIAQSSKNVWLWYSCVAEGGRVDEIEALGMALQRWESEHAD